MEYRARMLRRRLGSGPPVVLVHALGGSAASWDEHAEYLALRHTVVIVDLPGHDGISVPQLIDSEVGPVVDMDQVARDLAATIREERIEPAVVIGHSLGGTVSARVPLVDPDAASGVVIVDSVIAALPVAAEERKGLAEALVVDREMALRGFYARIARPAQLRRIVAGALKVPSQIWMGYVLATTVQSIPDGGRALDVPVLLQTSSVFIPEDADARARLNQGGFAHVRDLTVDKFPDALHWLQWEDPQGWRASTEKFLSRF
jgi:pimeloyl-ACP methyl ester carboxylesterase